MKKRSGFTLIELLVVIAIIALLMAVLMPALARVRAQAKVAACLSNLHSWGLMFQMYAEDNNGMLGDGKWSGNFSINARAYRSWLAYLRPYSKNDRKLTCCPMATKPQSQGARGKYSAWGIFAKAGSASGPSRFNGYICNYDGSDWSDEIEGYQQVVIEGAWSPESPGDRGSYGMNGWCAGMPEDKKDIEKRVGGSGLRPLSGHWKTIHVRNAGTVPLLLDSIWVWGSPQQIDNPDDVEQGVTQATGILDHIRRFAINRHNGYVNALFLDFSAKPVGIKELWILKWSREYVIDSEQPDQYDNRGAIQTIQTYIADKGGWPQWMKSFKEYYPLEPRP